MIRVDLSRTHGQGMLGMVSMRQVKPSLSRSLSDDASHPKLVSGVAVALGTVEIPDLPASWSVCNIHSILCQFRRIGLTVTLSLCSRWAVIETFAPHPLLITRRHVVDRKHPSEDQTSLSIRHRNLRYGLPITLTIPPRSA